MAADPPALPDFPGGLRLFAGWQAGETAARDELAAVLQAGAEGGVDADVTIPAPIDHAHVSGSIDLLPLGVMFDLFGVTAAEFYKGDPPRYVRSVMTSLRLLGMNKLYLSWPVYALTAEALGQPMIYSDRFSPGTDPGDMLVDADNWQDLPPIDLTGEIPVLLDETVAFYRQLTGNQPVLHLAAPYSLAADIFGQEHLINALTHEPEFVHRFLDRLADTVLQPWMDHFFAQHPDGWVELSDASGSPFFIGPENCTDVAIRSILRLKDRNPWASRVYDANYRGDYVTQAGRRNRPGSRRRNGTNGGDETGTSLADLFAAKNRVNTGYVIRLADDRVDPALYVTNAIEQNVPLFMGIGATQVDRHGAGDLEEARRATAEMTGQHVEAIKTVAHSIAGNGYESREPPWPGTVYFEDVSAESSFDLIEAIVGTTLREGAL